MAIENTSTRTTAQAAIATVSAGSSINDATFQQMLNVLNELVNHTHVMFDDYSTACNCNCNCNCTRGII